MNKYANTYMTNLGKFIVRKLIGDNATTFVQGEGNPVSAGSPPSRRSQIGRLRGVSGGHTVTSIDKAQGIQAHVSLNAGSPSRFSREVGVRANVVPFRWYPPNSNVNLKNPTTIKFDNNLKKKIKSMAGGLLAGNTFPTSNGISANIVEQISAE